MPVLYGMAEIFQTVLRLEFSYAGLFNDFSVKRSLPASFEIRSG